MPLFHLLPCRKTEVREFPHYQCPCYLVSSRRSLGEAANFVMYIMVPSSRAEAHWTLRGAALLMQTTSSLMRRW